MESTSRVYYTYGGRMYSISSEFDIYKLQSKKGMTVGTEIDPHPLPFKSDEWDNVISYLETGKLDCTDDNIEAVVSTLSQLGVATSCDFMLDGGYQTEFIKITLEEMWFRKHYDKITDPDTFLIKLDKSHVGNFKKLEVKNKESVIKTRGQGFKIINPKHPNKKSWYYNVRLWNDFPVSLLGKEVFVAGGAVTGAVGERYANDTDLFLVCSEERAPSLIIELLKSVGFPRDVMITANSINFTNMSKYQIILRLYKSKAEIITGFDVDACCALWDGTDIWVTPRCLYSWTYACNTVNLDLLSTTYEPRLVKYLNKGFSIVLPEKVSTSILLKSIKYSKYLGEKSRWYSDEGELVVNGRKKCGGLLAVLIMSVMQEGHLKIVSDYEIGPNKFKYFYKNSKYKPFKDPKMKVKFSELNMDDETDRNIIKSLMFKTRNPGEQICGSFHKKVMEDWLLWFSPVMKKLPVKATPKRIDTVTHKLTPFLQIPSIKEVNEDIKERSSYGRRLSDEDVEEENEDIKGLPRGLVSSHFSHYSGNEDPEEENDDTEEDN
jgi:hypothetical protein